MDTLDICRVIGKDRPEEPADFHRLLPIRWIREFDAEPYKSGDWVRRVAELRTLALQQVTAPFWLSLDADIRLSPNALLVALDWLKVRPKWGGVGFWTDTKGTRPRTDKGLCMNAALFRSEATEGLTFRVSDSGWCECVMFGLDLRDRGYTVGYHPALTAVHLMGD